MSFSVFSYDVNETWIQRKGIMKLLQKAGLSPTVFPMLMSIIDFDVDKYVHIYLPSFLLLSSMAYILSDCKYENYLT